MKNGWTVTQLARRAGTSADTIRYCERIGLLPAVRRSPAGYRLFEQDAVEGVAFIKRAQQFGLQLDGIRELLDVRERGLCPCGHARRLLPAKLAEIDEQMQALASLCDDIVAVLSDGGADAVGC